MTGSKPSFDAAHNQGAEATQAGPSRKVQLGYYETAPKATTAQSIADD